MYLGEFIGTMVLIIFGNGVVANVVLRYSKGEGGGWMVVTTGWAFAVVIAIFCAVGVGSPYADLNPVMTLTRVYLGWYTPLQALGAILCQMLGAFFGAVIVWLHFSPHYEQTEDSDLILATFATGPAIRDIKSNIISEIIGTSMLVLPIYIMVKANIPMSIFPCVVGILIWTIGLSLGGTTGYALNPARDLGPRIAHAVLPIKWKGESDWSYAWVPIVGPLIGGGLSFLIAKLIGIL